MQSLVQVFADEFLAHLGTSCPLPRDLPFHKIVGWDAATSRFLYDLTYASKQPDWTSLRGSTSERRMFESGDRVVCHVWASRIGPATSDLCQHMQREVLPGQAGKGLEVGPPAEVTHAPPPMGLGMRGVCRPAHGPSDFLVETYVPAGVRNPTANRFHPLMATMARVSATCSSGMKQRFSSSYASSGAPVSGSRVKVMFPHFSGGGLLESSCS